MSISIWRYCHLVLAVVSSLFLLMASVTGVILAVEPIAHQAKGYAVANLDEVNLAQTATVLKDNFEEVFSLDVESSGFVKASVLTDDFETRDIYINPKTGEELGTVTPRPAVYSFATNLHRSLFLKGIGRFFVGLVSFLLFIITVTGMILIAKRQGGFSRLFSKVKKEYFEMRYHVIFGRWIFIPIIILSLTGVYLSAEKFDLLPSYASNLTENKQVVSTKTYESLGDIPLFQKTKLSEIRKVDFPFSDEADDYFHIALKDREITVNQQTGEIVSISEYPFVLLASQMSLVLHTGEGSVLWSLVLLIASASLIFFMYSGFFMTIKRRKKSKTPKITKALPLAEDSEYIILVGSENGNTYDYAERFFTALIGAGKKAYITELNYFQDFPAAKHLIVLTSTYGDGEAPTNARKFLEIFSHFPPTSPIHYSVVGFGSLEYPDYCAFAIEVDRVFQLSPHYTQDLPLFKINDGSYTAFEKWAAKWSDKREINLELQAPKEKKKKLKHFPFEVVERTEMNADYTFLLRLRPKKKSKFSSGDLISILPPDSDIPRQYSIAKVGDEILLSIKKHKYGKASNYLYSLQNGAMLSAALEINPHFHFPKKSQSAIFIANGTGIAPFLGMIDENEDSKLKVLWGMRTLKSSALYDCAVDTKQCYLLAQGKKNLTINRCYSREPFENRYVQDLVKEQAEAIVENFENNGTCMICGSLSMQNDVLDEIEKILQEKSNITMDVLIQKGQLKMDCY